MRGVMVAIALLVEDFWDLWYQSNPLTRYAEPGDDSDIIYTCPKRLGRGYERSIQLRGIELLLIDETYHDDLRINSSCEEFSRKPTRHPSQTGAYRTDLPR